MCSQVEISLDIPAERFNNVKKGKGGYTKSGSLSGLLVVIFFATFLQPAAAAEKPIVIDALLSIALLYGWGAERGINLAAEEINANEILRVPAHAIKEAFEISEKGNPNVPGHDGKAFPHTVSAAQNPG